MEQSAELDHWKETLNLKDEEFKDEHVEILWNKCFKATAHSCIHQYTKVIFFYYRKLGWPQSEAFLGKGMIQNNLIDRKKLLKSHLSQFLWFF